MTKTLQLAVTLLLALPVSTVVAQGPAIAEGASPSSTAGAPESVPASDAQSPGDIGSTANVPVTETGGQTDPSISGASVTEAVPPAAAAVPVEAAPVEAASETTTETPKAGGGGLVEEVIVTAQKREEKLMSVPIAIQAFSPAALEARGITNQAGLMRATPGLDIGSNAGFTTIFLRGVGTEAFLTADPSIANYIDGVYFPFSPSFSQEFGAVKRVEVLKGPQGTLFGRNAVGGAINVLTKQPDFQDASTDVSVSYGRFDTMKGSVYTNVPIADNMALNVSGFYSTAESYYHAGSTSDGKPLQREIQSGAKLKFRYDPIENLDLVFGLTKSHGQGNSDFPINLYPKPLGTATGVTADTGYTGHSDENLYLNSDFQVLQFEGKYEMPWLDIKLLLSQQYDSQPFNYDFDGSAQSLVSFNIKKHYADIHEGELQLLSNATSPGADFLTYTAGLFYFDNKQGFDPIEVTVANTPLIPNPSALFAGLGFNTTQINELLQNPYYVVRDRALAGTYSTSEYAQVTGKFNDYLSLTVGARYQDEGRHVIASETSLATNGGVEVGVVDWTTARYQDGSSTSQRNRTKRLTPAVTLDSHPFEDDTLVYASYKVAVKAHAYNTYAIYLPPEEVKPETTTAYEVGLKSTLFDDNLRLSTAAFLYNIKDLQTQFVSLINGGAVSFENAGAARIYGMDFDLTSRIFPSLVDGVDASLNGCWIPKAEYLNYDPASGFNPNPGDGSGTQVQDGLFSSNQDYTGHRITRSPKFTGAGALTKRFNIPGGPLEFGADYYYNSGYFVGASNTPDLHQAEYNTVGAHVSYLYEPWSLRATFAGTNITDRYYTAGVIGTDFGTNYRIAPPLQYAFKLDWSF